MIDHFVALRRSRPVSYTHLKGKTVAVIGGGNTAAADALFLSRICEKVILIHRRDTLRADRVYLNPLQSCDNLEFIWNSTVDALSLIHI